MDELLQALKAVAEPTRLRIVAILARTELTVNELCTVLGQSQPRVSRHLKLLCDAGVLTRHSEGTSAFFRPRTGGIGHDVLDALEPLVDADDPVIQRDLERLDAVRAERAAAAGAFDAGSVCLVWLGPVFRQQAGTQALGGGAVVALDGPGVGGAGGGCVWVSGDPVRARI